MTKSAHAINQASLRRIVRRFTYISQSKKGEHCKPMQLSKDGIQTFNNLIILNIHRLFDPRDGTFVPSLSDENRVRIDHTWFAKTVCEEGVARGIYGPNKPTNQMLVAWRKQIEQHLTHIVICACNTALDHRPPRAKVTKADLARALVLVVAVLRRPDVAGADTPPSGIKTVVVQSITVPNPKKRKRQENEEPTHVGKKRKILVEEEDV